MIKAKELRIGNIAKAFGTNGHPDSWIEVKVQPDHILTCNAHPEWWGPIPLTEEWMLKYGAKEKLNRIEENVVSQKTGLPPLVYPNSQIKEYTIKVSESIYFRVDILRDDKKEIAFIQTTIRGHLDEIKLSLPNVKHVHRMQNIFLDLFEIELKTIDP